MGKKSRKLLERILRCLEQDCPGQLRPCDVDGRTALFHRFVDDDRALLRINMICKQTEQELLVRQFREDGVYNADFCSIEIIRTTSALVEFTDGSLCKVDPAMVTFLDNENDGG